MSTALSVRVEDDVFKSLNMFAQKSKIQKNDIINNALRQYLYLQEVRNIRQDLKPFAEAQGFYNEDDLLNSIS